jgi:hypothetical protein
MPAGARLDHYSWRSGTIERHNACMRIDKQPWAPPLVKNRLARDLDRDLDPVAAPGLYFQDAAGLANLGGQPRRQSCFRRLFRHTYLLASWARKQAPTCAAAKAAMLDEIAVVSYRARAGNATAQEGDSWKGAIASIAMPAWRCARPASISATASNWNASAAACASMLATTSWTRSEDRAG